MTTTVRRDVYEDGHLVGKVIDREFSDGSSRTTVEKVYSRDPILGTDHAEIVQEIETDSRGNVHVTNRK